MDSGNDTAVDVGRLVCSRLDGLMTRAGFAPGQIGVSDDGVGVVYCADGQEFRERFPQVASRIGASAVEGACTDLSIAVELGGSPTLVGACLEGMPIDDLMAGVEPGGPGSHGSRPPQVPLSDALERLGRLLEVLLGSSQERAP